MVTKIPLFKLQEDNLTYFKTIIETMYKVLDDTKINAIFSEQIVLFFGETDIDVKIKISLPKSFFNESMIEENQYIGLSTLYLSKILERPTTRNTILMISKLDEINKLLIEFIDESESNFEIPIYNYDEKQQTIFDLDNEDLYDTQVTLNNIRYGISILFRDQKFVDFNNDNGFELLVNPDRELVRITTALTDIIFPKARTTIKGTELSILESLSGPPSKSIYDYSIIKNLVKLDSLESQINLSFGTESSLRITFTFFKDENCSFMIFTNPLIDNPDE